MARTARKFISREGRSYVINTFFIAVTVLVLGDPMWSLPLWILLVCWLFVFRSTDRSVPPSPLGVLSPVDGHIVAIAELYDPYLERQCYRVTLGIAALGEYAIRAPTEGKVMKQWYTQKGQAISSASKPGGEQPSSSPANAPPVSRNLYSMWIQTDEKDDVVVELWLRRLSKPRCYTAVGERVGQGKRCGFFPFGGRIDLLLPSTSRLNARAGDKVRAGVDIIGYFVHDTDVAVERPASTTG